MLYDPKWKETDAPTSNLPTFKPRWWFKPNRLDARPVAWSLINRPEDWTWKTYSSGNQERNLIVHTPSKHEFWVHSKGHYHLWDADRCSCTSRSESGQFQRWQQRLFHKAFCQWRDRHGNPPVDAAQFASHFVR